MKSFIFYFGNLLKCKNELFKDLKEMCTELNIVENINNLQRLDFVHRQGLLYKHLCKGFIN